MKMGIATAVIACCLFVASEALAQSDSLAPGAVVPTPIQSNNPSVPMEQNEMSSPMQAQGQASGSMVEQGMAGGASCLDGPSSETAGFSMGGGFSEVGQPMMSSQYPMDSGMGCSGCSGGFGSSAPNYSSSTYPSSGCCSSSGYYPSAGGWSAYGGGGQGFWGGGHWNRGNGWFGRRCCGY